MSRLILGTLKKEARQVGEWTKQSQKKKVLSLSVSRLERVLVKRRFVAVWFGRTKRKKRKIRPKREKPLSISEGIFSVQTAISDLKTKRAHDKKPTSSQKEAGRKSVLINRSSLPELVPCYHGESVRRKKVTQWGNKMPLEKESMKQKILFEQGEKWFLCLQFGRMWGFIQTNGDKSHHIFGRRQYIESKAHYYIVGGI